MRGAWLVLSVIVLGCTADNPLFGAGGDERGTAEGEGSSALTGKGSEGSGGETRGETSSASTTRATSDTSAGEAESSDGTGSHGDESSESGQVCTPPQPIEVAIEVAPPPSDADPTCAGVWMSPQGPLVVSGDTISVVQCACDCMANPGAEAAITVTGVELGPLPSCGYVLAWRRPHDGECEWAGLAVLSSSNPAWIVSRTPFVPEEVFGGLTVGVRSDELCASPTCAQAGRYELEFFGASGDNHIGMDDEPTQMTLPFYASLPYLVDNVTSVRDEQCVEHVAWTATYDG